MLLLRRGEDRRLRAGHLWVFSNEVDVQRTPLDRFSPGEAVLIADHTGRVLGSGYVNPHSLICARLLDRHAHPLDRSLVTHRLNIALSLRQRIYPTPHYRLVFGDSDGLPGLTVDRFGQVLVAQATTAGMQALREEVDAALVKVLAPDVVVWKNDSSARRLEGLDDEVFCSVGEPPSHVEVMESGCRFHVDGLHGQKTGWFFDQRDNRDRVMPWLRDSRVLDLFCYAGGWGVRAACAGASSVDCVDGSADAVDAVMRNAALNDVTDRVTATRADAFEFLRDARQNRSRWDAVVVDPPAFVKRKKDFKEGALAYRRINEAAMQVLDRDGLLVSLSCSHHMPRAVLLETLQAAARHLDRQLQVIASLQQASDHPVHAAIPETDYLKGFVCRVLPS
ncbi:MAG: class I SAM-dependent rRNA methyltransferase [Xanthomonadales bacterium]|nr:class I SAM-dependent rRNA methyltransferase [Xanthomonadales bacterium]